MSQTTERLLTLDAELNTLIQTGQALDGFEKFYADDVVMRENDAAPTVGKDANRQREIDFFGAVTEFRGADVVSRGANGDTTVSVWNNDFTHKEWGERKYTQVAVRRWRDEKIVEETFYYDA